MPRRLTGLRCDDGSSDARCGTIEYPCDELLIAFRLPGQGALRFHTVSNSDTSRMQGWKLASTVSSAGLFGDATLPDAGGIAGECRALIRASNCLPTASCWMRVSTALRCRDPSSLHTSTVVICRDIKASAAGTAWDGLLANGNDGRHDCSGTPAGVCRTARSTCLIRAIRELSGPVPDFVPCRSAIVGGCGRSAADAADQRLLPEAEVEDASASSCAGIPGATDILLILPQRRTWSSSGQTDPDFARSASSRRVAVDVRRQHTMIVGAEEPSSYLPGCAWWSVRRCPQPPTPSSPRRARRTSPRRLA